MFDHVVKDMCEDEKHITAFLTLYKQLSGKITGENAEVAMGFVKYIFDHSYSDLYEQLEGMATSFGKHCKKYESLMSDITADKLALLQVVYQLAMNNIDDFMACTSVVVADQSDDDNKNGHVYHGRNLDWLNPDLYAPLATELTYVKKNDDTGKLEKVAVTMSFFPELTPTTAISKGFSFSYDARKEDSDKTLTCLGTQVYKKQMMENSGLPSGDFYEPFALYLRKRMLAGADYESVLDELKNSVFFCSAVYLVISGPEKNQGAVLTYSPKDLTQLSENSQPIYVQDLKDENLYDENGEGDMADPRQKWYVVVSNNDVAIADYAKWDNRYKLTINTLNNAGSSALTSIRGLEKNLLAVDGVRTERTCYVGTMDVKNFQYSFIVRGQKPKEEPNNNPPAEPEAAASLKPWAYAFILLGCIVAALF